MKKTLILPVLALTLALSSCGLLPVEEERPSPPILHTYDEESYAYAEVARGDVVSTLAVTGRYSPAVSEDLTFSEDGLPIAGVYVELGDEVKAGDVIAELDRGDILTELSEVERSIALLDLEIKYLDDSFALDVQAAQLKPGSDAAVEKLTADHGIDRRILELQMEVLEARRSELDEASEKRVLTAGIDGTVTKLTETSDRSTSSSRSSFATVSDQASSIFAVTGSNAELFSPGNAVTVTYNKTAYAALVADPKELGLTPAAKTAYIETLDAIVGLQSGASCQVSLVLEQRLDVLFVPSRAVRSVGGQSIVYVLDGEGLRTMREVETGLAAGGNTEIISGLEAGELVIVE